MIKRTFDEATGIISVEGTGLYTFTEIEQHYAALRELVAHVRSSGNPVRLLSDVSHGVHQAGWVEDYILDQMTQTFRDGDRVAFLTSSDTDKAHIESLGGHLMRSFTDRKAAEKWLAAPESPAVRKRPKVPTAFYVACAEQLQVRAVTRTQSAVHDQQDAEDDDDRDQRDAEHIAHHAELPARLGLGRRYVNFGISCGRVLPPCCDRLFGPLIISGGRGRFAMMDGCMRGRVGRREALVVRNVRHRVLVGRIADQRSVFRRVVRFADIGRGSRIIVGRSSAHIVGHHDLLHSA